MRDAHSHVSTNRPLKQRKLLCACVCVCLRCKERARNRGKYICVFIYSTQRRTLCRFDVALRVDTQRFNTVLSNQPELARADTTSLLDASRTTLQRVTFATTPRMSTYLLAFVVGTFASVRAPPYAIEPADPNAARAPPRVEIHVYSTPDTVNQVSFLPYFKIHCFFIKKKSYYFIVLLFMNKCRRFMRRQWHVVC